MKKKKRGSNYCQESVGEDDFCLLEDFEILTWTAFGGEEGGNMGTMKQEAGLIRGRKGEGRC